MADHRTLHVDIVGNASSYRAAMKDSARETREFGREADTAVGHARRLSDEIDSMSGRIGLMVQGFLAVGPSIAPLSAAAIAGLSGIANQTAFAAAGAGTAALAFMGMGDALEALNDYALDPTAENVDRVTDAMSKLAPEAQAFAVQLHHAADELRVIQEASAAGFFPGAGIGLDRLLEVVPRLADLTFEVGSIAGDITADMGGSLTAERAQEFLDFFQAEARPAMTAAYETAKNLTGGLAEMWMAFDPVNDQVSNGLVAMSERFDQWAQGLDGSEKFEDFLDYVAETGPQVVETAGSLANAVLQIGEAAAPLGGPILQGLETVADTISIIADSPLGPPIMTAVTAMSLLSLATKAFGSSSALSFAQARTGAAAYVATLRGANGAVAQAGAARSGAKALGAAGGLVAASAMGAEYTALGAIAGSALGPIGIAAGAAVGGVLDLTSALNAANEAAEAFDEALVSGDVSQIERALDAKRKAIEEYEEGFGLKTLFQKTWDAFDDDGFHPQMLREQSEAEKALTAATEASAKAQGYASDQERERVESLHALKDAAMQAANADLNLEQAQLDLADAVKDNGRVVDSTGNALKGSEQAAIDSRRELLRTADAWNEVNATAGQTPGQARAMRRSLIQAAVDMGYSRGEARKYVNTLLDIPRTKPTKIDLQIEEAMNNLNAFAGFYNSIRSKTVTITTQHAGYGSDLDNLMLGPMGNKPKARGGIEVNGVTAFARGGFGADGRYYDRTPQIVTGGTDIRWGELETGWEAYISGHPAHRERNVGILHQTASRFGYDLRQRGAGANPVARFGSEPGRKYGSEPARSGRVEVHHHHAEFPDRVRLSIGGQDFVATVDRIATNAAARTGRSAASNADATDRMNWS